MSQLSLLLQSRLRNLKQEKNQSQQWISEVKNHPAWAEIRAKDRRAQIDNLVLVAYLFTVRPGQSSQEVYGRVSSLASVLLSFDFRLLDYPEPSEICRYPSCVVCTCGHVVSEGESWGLLKHCSRCKGKGSNNFFVPMFQDGIARTGTASREWAEWAQVQAILLRNKRNNLRTHTAIVSLSSEKEDDRTP
ncbi:hypothetical protein D3C81_1588500 [compost metagenome]